MNISSIKPLEGKLLVEITETDLDGLDSRKSSIVMVGSTEKWEKGRVLAKGKLADDIEIGDSVFYNRFTADKIRSGQESNKISEKEKFYRILQEGDISLVIKDEEG